MQGRSPYFVNGAVDALLIGGLSILLYAAFKHGPFASSAAMISTGLLVALFNWPHFAATNQRLYGSLADARQYPVTAVLCRW